MCFDVSNNNSITPQNIFVHEWKDIYCAAHANSSFINSFVKHSTSSVIAILQSDIVIHPHVRSVVRCVIEYMLSTSPARTPNNSNIYLHRTAIRLKRWSYDVAARARARHTTNEWASKMPGRRCFLPLPCRIFAHIALLLVPFVSRLSVCVCVSYIVRPCGKSNNVLQSDAWLNLLTFAVFAFERAQCAQSTSHGQQLQVVPLPLQRQKH